MIGTDAASAPEREDAGTDKHGLDDAISAALNASEAGDDYPPEVMAERSAQKTEGETKPETAVASEDESAGDEGRSEDVPDGGEKQAPQVKEAPKHWPQKRRETFAAMPPEVQAAWLEHDKEIQGGFTRKSQELSDKVRFADEVRGLFSDADREQMSRAGTDERGTVHYLLGLQRFASQQPVEYLKWAMQHLGVKPDQLFSPQGQQPPGQEQADPMADLLVDPAVKQLEARLAAMEAERQEERRRTEAAQRTQYQSSVSTIQREIKTFRESLDDSGNLKFPHFDNVQKHMGALMESDPDLSQMPDGQDKLQKAYDMAVWARPDLRASYIEQETQKRLQEADKKREAERARKVTAVKPAAGTVTTRPQKPSLDDAITSTMSKFGL
jgi:hypothetical protein